MVRVLNRISLVAALVAGTPAVAQDSAHDVVFGVDVSYVSVSGYDSWTDGSVGKLRHTDDGLVLSRAFLDYKGRIADTLDATVVLEAYDDGLGTAIDLTEAYLEWRPVPRSPNRWRLKGVLSIRAYPWKTSIAAGRILTCKIHLP